MRVAKVGDTVKVITKLYGNKLCTIDSMDDKFAHFSNKNKFGLLVNRDRLRFTSVSWRGSNFIYTSFN